MFGEEKMLAAFKAHPPDYIVAVPRRLGEYGVKGFGQDYAENLAAWVEANYEAFLTVSPESTKKMVFGKLYIMRHKHQDTLF
jgi:hypothetical protein